MLSRDWKHRLLTSITFKHAVITGVAAAVPIARIVNSEETWEFPAEFTKAAISKTGVIERRKAPTGVCASDLGYYAADRLLSEMEIDKNEVDALIFVSQGPDFQMPMTSALLQARLGLGTSVLTFDLNIGCSGYVHGLMVAFSLVESGLRKVLLINGEVASRRYSSRDKSTAFLFGDAGAATIIQRQDEISESFFELSTNGYEADAIIIPAGGARNPRTPETQIEQLRADGSYRSDEQGFMDGPRVFSTVISAVPRQVESCMFSAGANLEDIDQFIFHQASKIVNEHLRKKIGIHEDKFPYSVSEFGNTSGVSIPLTMVSGLRQLLQSKKTRAVLSGYGVGMSWGSAVLNLPILCVPDLVEV